MHLNNLGTEEVHQSFNSWGDRGAKGTPTYPPE
jgi:hypothetical protein